MTKSATVTRPGSVFVRGMILATTLLLVASVASSSVAEGHDYAPSTRFLWDMSVSPAVGDSNTSYNAKIQSAVNNIDTGTNLTAISYCGYTCGPIEFNQASYPWYTWVGVALPRTNNISCATITADYFILNGACDTSSNKADEALILLNSSNSDLAAYPDFFIRHELLHVFGFNHNTVTSVMNVDGWGQILTVITTHDIGDINGHYP